DKLVWSIDHQSARTNDIPCGRRPRSSLITTTFAVWNHPPQPVGCGPSLVLSEIFYRIRGWASGVCHCQPSAIDNSDSADSGGCEIQQRGASETSCPHDQDLCIPKFHLAFYTEITQDKVSAVSLKFGCRQIMHGVCIGSKTARPSTCGYTRVNV